MKKLLLAIIMVIMVMANVDVAEAAVYTDVHITTGDIISDYSGKDMCKIASYQIWGYDTTNRILMPLTVKNLTKMEHMAVGDFWRTYITFDVEVPNTGGEWIIRGAISVDILYAHQHFDGEFLDTVVLPINMNYTSAYSPDNQFKTVELDGSLMQLSWENAATVSREDRTQTLRVDIPNMNRYTLTYQTSNGNTGAITGSTTNIPLGAGPYTTVTVIAKKGDTEIGKKSIGIFVQ